LQSLRSNRVRISEGSLLFDYLFFFLKYANHLFSLGLVEPVLHSTPIKNTRSTTATNHKSKFGKNARGEFSMLFLHTHFCSFGAEYSDDDDEDEAEIVPQQQQNHIQNGV